MSSDLDLMRPRSVPPGRHLLEAPDKASQSRDFRRGAWMIVGCAVVAAMLRLPFVWTRLSIDEGGYAYIAQQWARGAHLYDTAWLDRPQGLLIVYRTLLWLDDSESGWTIRVGAVLVGTAMTLLLGLIGWLMVGRRVGVAAAAIYAVAGVAPHLEGFTLNGELLASLPATAAIACILLWRRSGTVGWLLAAGLSAGVAVTMKPSGLDGIAVSLVVIAVSVGVWRTRGLKMGMFLAATMVPLAACALHGWYLGWSDYWAAIAGYQLDAMGGAGSNLDTRWADFFSSLGRLREDLAVIAVIALAGLWFLRRNKLTLLIVITWLLTAVVGINLGGSYWPHYYVQLLPPLVLLAAIAVAAITRRSLCALALTVTVLPSLIWFAALIPMTSGERQREIPYYNRALRDERIAAVVQAETRPSDEIYVLVSEANTYFLAQRTTSYPYLWGKPIEKIPGAVDRLQKMLAGSDRPVLVLLYRNPDSVDPSGGLSGELARHYRVDRDVEGVTFLRARS